MVRQTATRILILVGILLGSARTASSERDSLTYAAVVAGMNCRQNSASSLECDYRVGQSLHFVITGVGDDDAGISFFSSSFDGDYYAGLGVMHGCVVVSPGRARSDQLDFAFVSPRDGKVYRDWPTCRRARRTAS